VLHESWEFPVLRAVNAAAGRSALLDHLMHSLTSRDLLQGVVFIGLIWYLWFDVDERQRPFLLTGIIAASCAGFFSRLLQLELPTHPRPLHTPGLGFVMPLGVQSDVLNHYNAFPSDHGTVYFSLVMVAWLVRPRLGVAAFAWAVIVDLARVYEGYHWPSDILAAIGLSLLAAGLAQNQWLQALARRALVLEQRRRAWFYLVAFLVTYQVATLFDDIRQVGRGIASVMLHHDPFTGA
jgi:undecaprenyl-diphosphatase